MIAVQSEEISRPHVVDLVSSLAPSQAPQTRSKAKAKADQPPRENTNQQSFDPTPLKSLFIDGMDDEQIWAQVDLRTQTICRMLEYVLEGEMEEFGEGSEGNSEDDDERLRQALEALKADDDIDMETFLENYGIDESELEESEDVSSQSGDDEAVENISPLRDPSSDEENDSDEFYVSPKKLSKKRKLGEVSELDDDFFDLAEFNAYTERAEAKSSSRGRLAGSDSDEEDDGIDLFANIDSPATVEEEDDSGGMSAIPRIFADKYLNCVH